MKVFKWYADVPTGKVELDGFAQKWVQQGHFNLPTNLWKVLNPIHRGLPFIRVLTSDSKMWAFMEYEMFHFNTTCQIYLEVIEMKIQKIKKTSNTSNILPLPPYPEITEQFQIALEYLKAQPREPANPKASNDSLTHCYICTNDYVNGDQVLICKTCKKPVHRSCWMKWLEKQNIETEDQTCGLCRQPMVVRRYE